MNRNTKIIVFAAIAIIILGMALYPTIKRMIAPSIEEGAPTGRPVGGAGRSELVVTATELQPQVLNNMFRIRGVLLPDEEVDLTFESSGKITNINFQEGTFVKEGTLLAKVNDAPLQARSEERRVGKECRCGWVTEH